MTILSVRVTQDELEKLREISADRGMSVSEFVRNMLRDRLSPPCVTPFEGQAITSSALTHDGVLLSKAIHPRGRV